MYLRDITDSLYMHMFDATLQMWFQLTYFSDGGSTSLKMWTVSVLLEEIRYVSSVLNDRQLIWMNLYRTNTFTHWTYTQHDIVFWSHVLHMQCACTCSHRVNHYNSKSDHKCGQVYMHMEIELVYFSPGKEECKVVGSSVEYLQIHCVH